MKGSVRGPPTKRVSDNVNTIALRIYVKETPNIRFLNVYRPRTKSSLVAFIVAVKTLIVDPGIKKTGNIGIRNCPYITLLNGWQHLLKKLPLYMAIKVKWIKTIDPISKKMVRPFIPQPSENIFSG